VGLYEYMEEESSDFVYNLYMYDDVYLIISRECSKTTTQQKKKKKEKEVLLHITTIIALFIIINVIT